MPHPTTHPTTAPTAAPRRRRFAVRVAATASALALGVTATACSSSDSSSGSSSAAKPGTVSIVASTSVYGSIASAVAGDKASVSSIVDSPTADPHSYEATPADAAKIGSASLVVYNGAGYDEFVTKALDGKNGIKTVEAVDVFAKVTGVTVEDHDAPAPPAGTKTTDNEHVWYSLKTAAAIADEIAQQLGELDPADAATFTANAKTFAGTLTPVEDKVAAIAAGPHVDFAQTEPVAGHLFEDMKFEDLTPAGFTSAIENDADPSAADFDATRTLLTDRKVAFLALNSQTETPTVDRLKEAADTAKVPVVDVTETLPEGKDYAAWMTDTVNRVGSALGR